MGLRHHLVEEGEVIAEGEDALRLGDLGVGAEAGAEEGLGHGRDVLVREAHVGADEERVARLDRGDADLVGTGVDDGVGGISDYGGGITGMRERALLVNGFVGTSVMALM